MVTAIPVIAVVAVVSAVAVVAGIVVALVILWLVARLVRALAAMIASGHFDVALGSRIIGRGALTGGIHVLLGIGRVAAALLVPQLVKLVVTLVGAGRPRPG